MSELLMVRIRGTAGVTAVEQSTFDALKLQQRNACALTQDTPVVRGLIRKIGHHITWGELTDKSVRDALAAKAKKTKNGLLYTSLTSPKKGFERKGIKKPYTKGGALGYRGEAIASLVKNML